MAPSLSVPISGSDAFATRTLLPGPLPSGLADTVGFSAETNEPQHFFLSEGRSAWWRWAAPATGMASISVEGAGRAGLAVYEGSSFGAMVLLRSDVASTNGTRAVVQLPTRAGYEYPIAADFVSGYKGRLLLFISFTAAPGHDAVTGSDGFIHAQPLFGLHAVGVVNNRTMRSEPNEPSHFSLADDRTAWWRWTPISAARCNVSVEGAGVRTGVAVYVGGAFRELVRIAGSASSTTGVAATTSFTAAAGVEHRFVADTFDHRPGNLTLKLDCS